jgi:hypothetical protein
LTPGKVLVMERISRMFSAMCPVVLVVECGARCSECAAWRPGVGIRGGRCCCGTALGPPGCSDVVPRELCGAGWCGRARQR